MSSTRRDFAFKAIAAGDLSQATVTSTISNIKTYDHASVMLIGSGSPNGTWAVQVSNLDLQPTLSSQWVTLSIVPALAWSGTGTTIGAGSLDIKGWRWIRLVYTKNSGTGSVDAWIAASGS